MNNEIDKVIKTNNKTTLAGDKPVVNELIKSITLLLLKMIRSSWPPLISWSKKINNMIQLITLAE
ncbi:hypothetical protein SE856_03930 [Mycoplasmoides gallisepticum]|nr:hypothetical protein SE856_03930 [Mycoplasmoides gallisepticum]